MGLRVRLKRGVNIAGLPYQARVVAQQLPRHVGVIGEHRGAGAEHEVVCGQRFPDRPDGGRQDSLKQRMVLGEADPPPTRGRCRVDR